MLTKVSDSPLWDRRRVARVAAQAEVAGRVDEVGDRHLRRVRARRPRREIAVARRGAQVDAAERVGVVAPRAVGDAGDEVGPDLHALLDPPRAPDELARARDAV